MNLYLQGFLTVGDKRPSSGIPLVAENEKKPMEVEMKCSTREEQVFDVGGLYPKFCGLSDKRKPKGLRYRWKPYWQS